MVLNRFFNSSGTKASAWDKFVLLTWKNWLIQWRHPIQSTFEVLIPVAVCSLLIVIRGLIATTEYPKDFTYEPIEISDISRALSYVNQSSHVLAYSPTNSLLNGIVSNVANRFDLRVESFVNASELEKNGILSLPFASIEFDQILQSTTQLPNIINYALRFPAELRGSSSEDWGTNYKLGNDIAGLPRNQDSNDGGIPPGYIAQGFIALQNAIEREIIMSSSGKTDADLPQLKIERFPYPAYTQDIVGIVLEFMLPFLLLVAFLYNCINNIKYITIEKEYQLKSSMQIMGLPSYMHWLAWLTKCMIFQIVIISIVTGMFKIGFSSRAGLAVFTYTNWIILWLFLFVYALSAVTFAFMFSVFFSKANTASITGAIVWFVTLTPFNLIGVNYETTATSIKLLISLLCNSGMGMGFKVMTQYETAGAGVQWSNLFSPISPDDDLTVGAIMLMLLLASVIQMLITLYVEKVMPGEFGVAEKLWFPFSIKFWTGKSSNADHVDDFVSNKNPLFEDEPTGKRAGIQVRGLTKIYGGKMAVNNLSLNMYEDQITVLLGHNGAGKSTTIGMLTGLFPPNSGTAFINGEDIRTNLESIRASFGFCPQHNVLFNELTVREHITFFSKLKGLKNSSDIEEQIRKYVNLLELTPKINSQSHTLSGGMKRKLSIGISLCGNSKIVLIDEATSGMDPAARRALWDLLIKEKKDRTILLTTHFMDEADVLGDRIAIMAEGKLKTVGTSFFLKKKFGVGYRLVCVKNPDCDSSALTNLLSKYIPNIQVETDIGSELTYVLNESYVKQFQTIFSDLEDHSESLKVSSYGVSLTTLEEVFLKVGTDSKSLTNEDDNGSDKDSNKSSTNIFDKNYTQLVSGSQLIVNQIEAMVIKKFFYQIRNYISVIIQCLVPVIFIVLTMATAGIMSGNKDLPELAISFDTYLDTVTTVEQGSMAAGSSSNLAFQSYQRIIQDLSSKHSLLVTEADIVERILAEYRLSVSRVNLNFIVGAAFSDERITAFFNNQPYHSAPLAINMVNNALLKSISGSEKLINVRNKPLPFSLESKVAQLGSANNIGFNVAFNTGFAFAFVSAMFVMFYIKENMTRAKLLQYVSGANKVIFWLVSFVIDYVLFLLISLLYIGVLAAFQEDGYRTFDELGRVFLVLVMFGAAMLPFTYLGAFLFRVPSSGLTVLSITYVISGVFFYLAFFMFNMEALGQQHIAKILGWVFLPFPHFSLAKAISGLNMMQSTIKSCGVLCEMMDNCTPQLICSIHSTCCELDYFSFKGNGIATSLVALAVIAVVAFFLLYAIEYRWIQSIFYSFRKSKTLKNIPESEDNFIDTDVYAEKEKIRTTASSLIANNNLLIKDMTKFYGKQLAVNQISVGVEKGECFGLLGVNGAGKTTTFKMLTGDESIDAGEAWVEGISIKTNMNKVHHRIGYCPQFDALIDDLTGRETLKIFALLRGIPRRHVAKISQQLADDFNFTKHLDKRIKAYSGGNKRKLSTALTLIGDPSLIYLDEPTSGMDVGSRRQLWNMVIKTRASGKSVILTSHSMEECEALCTRLAIMVNGEFKCLGSTQHLKNKFSKGFFLTIKAGQTEDGSLLQRVNAIKQFITQTFTGAVLKEEHNELITYHILATSVKWSTMFSLMEEAKEKLSIADYSLGQNSLEQVFLFFAKNQRENE